MCFPQSIPQTAPSWWLMLLIYVSLILVTSLTHLLHNND